MCSHVIAPMPTGDYNPYAEVNYSASGATFQMDTPTDDKGLPPSPGSPTSEKSFSPTSLGIITLWAIFIVGEIILLEKSVALAPTMKDLPWYYSSDGLPSVLLTMFTQGHTAVTGIHISRLAISALQSRRGAPRTWIELFWMADKQCAGVGGILMTVWTM